jgi:hypothetical protein
MLGHAPVGPAIYLVPLALIAIILLRSVRTRRLRVERLWFAPCIFIVMSGLILANQSPPALPVIAIEVVALALGAFAGWWRGRLTRIVVDPETHELTSKASAAGVAVIFAIFTVRYLLRSYAGQAAGWLHLSALHLTDILLVFAIGLVCVQRLEIALRATRLLNDARAGR